MKQLTKFVSVLVCVVVATLLFVTCNKEESCTVCPPSYSMVGIWENGSLSSCPSLSPWLLGLWLREDGTGDAFYGIPDVANPHDFTGYDTVVVSWNGTESLDQLTIQYPDYGSISYSVEFETYNDGKDLSMNLIESGQTEVCEIRLSDVDSWVW